MKASISSWSYDSVIQEGRMDLSGFVEQVKRLGADGFEIFGPHVDPDDPGGHIKRIADEAAAAGLEISSLIACNDFARPTACERAEQVERMKQCIDHAIGAGIPRINTFTGYHTSGNDPWLEAYWVIGAYREVMPAAEQNGVLLCLENHSSVCRDADGLLWLIRQVDSANLKTNPDFTNFVPEFYCRGEKSREAVYSETAKIAPLAANAHLKIAEFSDDGEHAHVDTSRLIGILAETGYDGHIVLEVYAHRDRPDEICARGLALLRKYL